VARIDKRAQVPYSPQQMFDLVNEVDQYPNFLPWCGGAEIVSRDEQSMRARVMIAKGPVQKRFETQNRLVQNESIEMRLVDGPFKKLNGRWTFVERPNGCEIRFVLDFEFANMLVSMAIGPVFQQIANTMVDSFIQQARVQYGD